MTTISNFIMKKNSSLAGKTKKKSIPININTNPMPGKIFITNHINPIASSYLSMGQKIQINKNLKNQKLIHVNTNSGVNYYTMNGKDSKQTNSSATNSLFNNFHNNNSDINGINFNNYLISNNNHSQHHYGVSNMDKNIIKYSNINTKARKHLSTISNSLISNELLINGYQTSKNNTSNLLNNNKPRSKIINTNSKNSVSKIRQTYSTRPNFLDSRNKTKKVPMKSKLVQFKYQYRGKPVSTSFSNVRVNKNNFQGSAPRDIYNYIRSDMINNNTYENIQDKLFLKNNFTNGNFIINNNLYELKSKHFRHNTASFDNKDIINIFNKKNLSNKSSKIINNVNINNLNNINNNVCINNIDSNNQNRNMLNKNNNFNNEIISPSNQMMNKINNRNIRKKNQNQFGKGKINDIKIYVNEKKLIQKENHNQNIYNNKQNSYYTNININNIYHNYHNNNDNLLKDNYSNLVHHMKNAHSINMNIPGIKKISIKQRDKKNNMMQNQNKQINKPIPTPGQKIKNNIIPSQRNIKINLAKFLKDVKIKQNNKSIVGRKSLSIKRISKENNSDFSLSQLNDKFAQKILKNNEEGNDIGNCVVNNRQNANKTIQEEIRKVYIPEEKKNSEIDNNNILIDTNYISNIQNKGIINRTSNIPLNLINEICQNNVNTGNNMKYCKLNYNTNASTTNNNYYGSNKNDYSVDNIPDITNKDISKNKENINDLNLNNVTDIDKTNANKNDLSSNTNDINENINKENLSNININNKNNDDLNTDDDIISKNNNKNNINNDDDYKIETNKVVNLEDNANIPKLIENNISNDLFDEDNLNELPEDYDENFNDLYSIINKMNYGNVLVCVEGLFTPEGRTYKKYKDKFDKLYNKLFYKKGNSFTNSNNKPKKIMEGTSVASNAKTNSSSSKKNIINPMYNNELNLEKVLNAY
jgi:hypothetical protein